MDRREFLRLLSYGCLAAAGLAPAKSRAGQAQERERPIQFVFAQLKYRGGDWNPHALAVAPLMEELMQRTSVEAAPARREMTLTDPDLFYHPFLYMSGKYEFEPFNLDEIDILRRFLSYGGFLLVDDALGQPGYGFDQSLRREMKRIFPEKEFSRLPTAHPAMRSYYLLRRIGGVRIVRPYVEGINIGATTPVVYCQNDLGGAWERDQLGNWINPCTPGGEPQRRDAFHLGINLILYAMTENYKDDLIHVPFIQRRLTR
jgi:hypothetical protein